MQEIDRQDFGNLLTDVMAYYGKDTSDFMLSAWWDACQNVSFEQVSKAINRHVRDAERGQFPPKVSDVVRALQGTTTDRAALAWGKVHGAMGSVGAYQDVVFDDAAIHAAIVDCGGWQKMCRSDLKELSFLQHRFAASHKAYTERGTFDYPRLISGDRSPDSEYIKFNRPLPTPAIVGDRLAAARVMAGGGEGGPRISFQSLQDLPVLIADQREAA